MHELTFLHQRQKFFSLQKSKRDEAGEQEPREDAGGYYAMEINISHA